MKTFARISQIAVVGFGLMMFIGTGIVFAQSVNVSVPSTAVTPGASITIPVNVGDLTGQNVTAYEFEAYCDSTIIRFTGVESSGTLSAGLGPVANYYVAPRGPGRMKVTCASATPMAGSGVLVYLKATAQSKLGTTSLTLSSFLFNTGSPSAVITNGIVRTGTNSAPVLAAISAKTVTEKDTLRFTASATDADLPNDTLKYSLANAPTGATIGSSTGAFLWVPATGQAGAYSVKVKVSDLFGASDSTTVSITVKAPNRAPSFVTKLQDTTISDNIAFTFAYTASDPDAGTTLTYKLESGPTGASLSSAGVFSWTPGSSQLGNFPIVVSVSDGFLADTAKATITVVHVNRPPTFTAKMADQTITVGSSVAFTYTASDPDAGTTLAFKLESGPSGATLSAAGQFSWTPSAQQTGTFNVIVSVSDGALADTAKAKITVNPANRAPSFVAKLPAQTINEGSTLSFTYTATDPDAGAVLTFSLVGAPSGASITSAGVFTFTPPSSPAASYLITAVVSDGSLTDTAKTTITVNRKPVLVSRTPSTVTTISRNVATTFSVNASDPDGNTLTYTWKINGVTETGATSNTLTKTFTDAHNTPKTVAVTFTDPGGLEGSSTWSFTITPVEVVELPTEFSLGQNYPNPFNPTTSISYSLLKESVVTLEIYNMLGVRIRTLLAGQTKSAGFYTLTWDGKDDAGVSMTSGIYLYRLNAGSFVASKKMTMLK